MNLIVLTQEDFVGAHSVRLKGRQLKHVLEVHRARLGDELRVGLLNSKLGKGVITALTQDVLEMEILLDREPPPALPLTLLLALPRPKSLKRTLQAATAMGVKHIYLMNSWRVEKSFWKSPVLEERSVREQLVLGLEQARDTVLPEVTLRRRFKPCLEDEVRSLIQGTRALLAHPVAEARCPHALEEPVTLAIGPEGGFIPYEVDLFRSLGFEVVSLGERTLRVEHAVPALLGRLF
jgi:RsmE family RNA methyltransferase